MGYLGAASDFDERPGQEAEAEQDRHALPRPSWPPRPDDRGPAGRGERPDHRGGHLHARPTGGGGHGDPPPRHRGPAPGLGRDRPGGPASGCRACSSPSPRRCARWPSASRPTSWPSCATSCARPRRSSSARSPARPRGHRVVGGRSARRQPGLNRLRSTARRKVGCVGPSQVGEGDHSSDCARDAVRPSRARRPDAVRLRFRPHARPPAHGAQGPPRRQGRQPGRDDVGTRAPGAARASPSRPTPAGPTWPAAGPTGLDAEIAGPGPRLEKAMGKRDRRRRPTRCWCRCAPGPSSPCPG